MENITGKEVKGKRSLSNKLIRVDMTPMVDLGFLLITFFMFTTNFSKPNIMDLSYPPKPPAINNNVIDFKDQVTFIIGKDNRVFYYQSELKDLNTKILEETTFEGSKIEKIIYDYKKVAQKPDFFTIIIKPTDDANYKNFVDMLDNMAITKSDRYGLSDLKPLEKKVYEEKIK
ncbi:ExbD/TolR family protein [Halpernia sp. GG3]